MPRRRRKRKRPYIDCKDRHNQSSLSVDDDPSVPELRSKSRSASQENMVQPYPDSPVEGVVYYYSRRVGWVETDLFVASLTVADEPWWYRIFVHAKHSHKPLLFFAFTLFFSVVMSNIQQLENPIALRLLWALNVGQTIYATNRVYRKKLMLFMVLEHFKYLVLFFLIA